jgi:hypothetical protein
MSLPLPELENETMYAVQLVRKYVPQALSPLERLGSQITEQNSRLGISGALLSSTVLSRTVNGVNVNMRTTGQQLLPGETVGLDEKLLYKFYFRTSRHNTLQEKLAAANVSATYVNAFIAEGFKINTYLQEPFDEFEIQGKYKNGTLVMKPLLNLTDPWLNSYHTSLVLPSVYDVQSRALSLVRASGYSSQVTIASLNRHGKGIPPKQTVSVVGNNSTVTTPIAQWQIQNEARRNSEYNQSSGNSSDAIQLSSTASQALGSASLVLNGGHSFNSAGISIAPSGPSSNFEMVMSTSAYVWGDFLDLQRSLARAMSFAPWPGTRFPIRTAIEADRILYPKVNSLLRQNVLTYRFNRGTYTIDMRYQRPIGNNQYTLGTQATKTFTY